MAILVVGIVIFIMIEQLIKLARKHPGFKELSDYALRVMFETYKNTTLIHRDNGEIKAFAIYQEWPEHLNFIAVCGSSDDRSENIKSLLKLREFIPLSTIDKTVCYFDETKMELKVLCHQQQQH